MKKIDRNALVRRNNPQLTDWDPKSPLSVGNGDFTFTSDITGLQTFGDTPVGCIPRCTMSQWGFHSYADAPDTNHELILKEYKNGERTVAYMTDSRAQEELYKGLRINPHRFHLGKVGLHIDSSVQKPSGIPSTELLGTRILQTTQKLDLWTGKLNSSFQLDGVEVSVQTMCHPVLDLLSIRIESPLLADGKIGLDLNFPYGSHNIEGADWSQSDKHFSTLETTSESSYRVKRKLDSFEYYTNLEFDSDYSVKTVGAGRHHWNFTTDREVMEVSIHFSKDQEILKLPSFKETEKKSAESWAAYWSDGGAVSFEECTDPRAGELERRIILSQYLLGLQSLGSLPPAETGLTCNSWYGKFHLEMHIWHALHALLWGRAALVEKSLDWYNEILASAGERAVQQGYEGIRWPKMTDPSGTDSPSSIGTLLCWQQPHIILFAELLYRLDPSTETLLKFEERVFQTAVFMVDYSLWDTETKRYILGPPLIPAQENHDPEETLNPVFELEYWRWALKTAVEWKKRMNQPIPEKWLDVLEKLSPCAVDEGEQAYAAHENCSGTYSEFATDHPSMLLAFGLLPPQSMDSGYVSNSFDRVLNNWQFDTMWGWDFPSMSMTLARLDRRKEAIDILLLDTTKNTYVSNGHNRQVGSDVLPLYLPGNGALLLAVAMMTAGWDGSEGNCPGFPDDGNWKVKSEGLAKYI